MRRPQLDIDSIDTKQVRTRVLGLLRDQTDVDPELRLYLADLIVKAVEISVRPLCREVRQLRAENLAIFEALGALDTANDFETLSDAVQSARTTLRAAAVASLAVDLGAAVTPTPQDRDPADYGSPSGDDGGDETETRCRVCGSLAIDHTRGRFSVYGVCPVTSTPEAATEGCDYIGCQHPMHFEAELQRAPEEQRE